MTCRTLSPDGKWGCTLLQGHHLNGSNLCKNTSAGTSWCGWCGEWECLQHEAKGISTPTPRPYELDKLMDN